MSVPSKHKKHAPSKIIFSLIIVSDSRYEQSVKGLKIEDKTAPMVREILSKSGYELYSVRYVPDSAEHILNVLKNELASNTSVILTSGGTGLSSRDVTIETVTPLFSKRIGGFGELLRFLSYREIGSAAMLTRATAGIIGDKVVFCLPGSPNAVKIALEKLIIPEVGHILAHIS